VGAWLPNLVGVSAALCSMASFAPQVVKLWREKDASALSLRTYAVTVTGFSLWVLYGVLLKSWPLTISNSVCVALTTVILALKIRYDGQRR
jgi:MtN3 and saliva related transmembrane protein